MNLQKYSEQYFHNIHYLSGLMGVHDQPGFTCSKLTIKTTERRQWHLSGVFIVNFEHISYIVLVFLLLTLNI